LIDAVAFRNIFFNVGGMKSKRIASDKLSATTEVLTGDKAPK